jgi:uncharacterized small protein (DUF1192 family)
MAIFDDMPPTRKPVHEIGADLALLSADELRSASMRCAARLRGWKRKSR